MRATAAIRDVRDYAHIDRLPRRNPMASPVPTPSAATTPRIISGSTAEPPVDVASPEVGDSVAGGENPPSEMVGDGAVLALHRLSLRLAVHGNPEPYLHHSTVEVRRYGVEQHRHVVITGN